MTSLSVETYQLSFSMCVCAFHTETSSFLIKFLHFIPKNLIYKFMKPTTMKLYQRPLGDSEKLSISADDGKNIFILIKIFVSGIPVADAPSIGYCDTSCRSGDTSNKNYKP